MSSFNQNETSFSSLSANQQNGAKFYDYPQENLSVEYSFEEDIKPLLDEIIEPSHVLQMFSHIQKQKAKNKVIYDPASYDSVVDKTTFSMALNPNYRNVYNAVYEKLKLKDYPVLEFIKKYEAYISTHADNSGVENGYVFNYFLEQAHGETGLLNCNLLVMNPSPRYIERICAIPSLKHKLAFYFTDDLYADAYKFDQSLLYFDIHNETNLTLSNRPYCVLIFGDTLNPTEIVKQLKLLKSRAKSTEDLRIFLYCPNTYIDGKEGRKTIHTFLAKEMILDSVSIIDEKAFCDKQRKHSVIGVRFVNDQGFIDPIPFQQVAFSKTAAGNVLIPQAWQPVPRVQFEANNKTLTTLLQGAKEHNNPNPAATGDKTESSAFPIIFSDEIRGVGTIEQTASNKYRLSITIHRRPNARQKRENRYGLGSAINIPVKGSSKPSIEEAENSVCEILLEKAALRSKIIEKLKEDYPELSELSIKTFWYLHLDETIQSSYNRSTAINLFCENEHLDIGSRIVSQCAEKDIDAFIEQMVYCGCTESYIHEAIKILTRIFALRGKQYVNPCQEAYANLTHKISKYQHFRDSQIRRSFSLDESKRLYSLFKDDLHTSSKGLAYGGIIKMFTGMHEAEICALRRENIVYEKDQHLYVFYLSHECAFHSTTRTELTDIDKKRKVPICNVLCNHLPLAADPSTKNKPLVFNSFGKAVTPKELKEYIESKIKLLGIEKCFLEVPGKGRVDINDYQGDWIRSNFDFAMRIVAKMLPDDLNSIMGRNLETTDGNHYRDYMCCLRQLAIRAKIDFWAESVAGNTNIRDGKTSLVIDNKKEDFTFVGCATPNINIIDIRMPNDSTDACLIVQTVQRFSGTIIIEELE